MNGFIKLNRDIQGTWLHKDAKLFKAWIDILFNVNWEPKEVFIGGTKYTCGVGESLNSLDTWASIFGNGWDKSKVRRFFKRLESATLIDTQNERKTTRLKLVNIDVLNKKRTQNERKTQHKTTPTKELRNNINNKLFIGAIIPEKLSDKILELFTEYLEMRVKKKKRFTTTRQIETRLKRLEKYVNEFGEDKTIECIEATLDNNWTDIKMSYLDNLPEQKQDSKELNLLDYYKTRRKFTEGKINLMKQKGHLEKLETKLKEVTFKCNNIAKTYSNPSIDALLVFDIGYGFLGNFLKTNDSDVRFTKFKSIISSQSDYIQNKGDILQLMVGLQAKTL